MRRRATNQLSFPLDQRVVIAGWKLLFLHRGTYKPDPRQERGMESRRLSGRGAGALRRLPYPAQCARRGAGERDLCRRRCRQLAGLCDQRAIAGAGALGCGRAVRLSARRLASRSRHRARADGGGGEQSVGGAGERRPRHRDLHGRRVRRAVAGAQAPGRSGAGAGRSQARRGGAARICTGARDLRRRLRRLPRSGRPPPYGGINLALSTAISGPDPRNLANIVLVGRPPGRGRAQPDHAGLCGEHERCAGRGLAGLSARRASATSRPGPTSKRSSRKRGARRPHIFRLRRAHVNAPADPAQRDKP